VSHPKNTAPTRWSVAAAAALAVGAMATSASADDEVDEAVIRAPRTAPAETLIGHAEIERTGAVTLADALRPQADVDTLGGGSPGAVGRLTLRGSTPEEVLLMVDGLRLSSRSSAATVGGADPNMIPTAMVQRLSVLRGPSSALFGPNAVAGAIEVTTRAPTVPLAWTGNLQLGALAPPLDASALPMVDDDDGDDGGGGWFLGGRGQLTAAMRQGPRFAVLGVSGSANRGWIPNTSSHFFDATLKLGRVLPGGGLTHAWVSTFDAATGAPAWGSLLDADMFDFDDRQARRGVMGAAMARVALSPRDTLEATVGSRVQRTQLFNPAGADLEAGAERAEDEHLARELQARVRWQRVMGGVPGALSVSAEGGHDLLATRTLARSASRGALSVRDRLDLGRGAVLDLALRADLDGQYGAQVSPRVAAEWSMGPSLRAFAAVGRGYRPPSFAELAWPTIAYATAVGAARGERGNDALAVETAWGGDLALLGGEPGGRWTFAARGLRAAHRGAHPLGDRRRRVLAAHQRGPRVARGSHRRGELEAAPAVDRAGLGHLADDRRPERRGARGEAAVEGEREGDPLRGGGLEGVGRGALVRPQRRRLRRARVAGRLRQRAGRAAVRVGGRGVRDGGEPAGPPLRDGARRAHSGAHRVDRLRPRRGRGLTARYWIACVERR
jgi:outer membrane receptor protein involved in Fe transport